MSQNIRHLKSSNRAAKLFSRLVCIYMMRSFSFHILEWLLHFYLDNLMKNESSSQHPLYTLAAAVPDKTFLIKSDELHQNTVKGSGEIFASTRLIMILDIFLL